MRSASTVTFVALLVLVVLAVWAVPAPGQDGDDSETVEPKVGKDEVDQEMAHRVEAVRRLKFRKAVPFREIDRDEAAAIIRLGFENEYGDGRAAERAFQALGLLKPGLRLRDLVLRHKSHQVKGFYLAKKIGSYDDDRLYIMEGLGDEKEAMLAHELSHALSDQYADLERLSRRIPKMESGQPDGDRKQALLSIEEGVAHLVARRVLKKDPPADKTAHLYDQAVPYTEARHLFRHWQGRAFIEAVYEDGGIERVNALYDKPPNSSEQIIHPELYLGDTRDLPQKVELPELTGELQGEWETLRSDVMGEFGVAWLLGVEAGKGWDGDKWIVIQSQWTDQVIACWFSTWDSIPDASELASAMRKRAPPLAALAADELLYIEQDGREVVVISGARRDQLLSLRPLAWKTKTSRAAGDGEKTRPEGSGAVEEAIGAAPGERSALYSARSGRTLIETDGERVEQVSVLRSDEEAREIVKELVKSLKDRARNEEDTVAAYGRKGWVETLEDGSVMLYRYKTGMLTVGQGSSAERLDDMAKFLEKVAKAR